MTRITIAGTLACLLALPAACGDSASAVPVTGHYSLDSRHFANALTDKLIEIGKAPEEVRTQMVGRLKNSTFDLDLRKDGTFTGRQSVLTERHSYKGTWVLAGRSIRIDQTHEDDVEKEDRLTGKLDSGKMTLRHEEDGVELTFIMHHESLAAPPR